MARNVLIEHGYKKSSFEFGGIRHDVYRGGTVGPPILLLHEMPSLSYRTVQLADSICAAGFRIVMPILIGGIRNKPRNRIEKAAATVAGTLEVLPRVIQVCVSWQFVALAQRRTSPITMWLLELARNEAAAVSRRRVGVIGMCFSGGFALATAIDPVVGVAVVSQPAMPFAWFPLNKIPGQSSSVGLADEDWQRLLDRRDGTGVCIRTLRFERDAMSPAARVARIKAALAPTEEFDCIRSEKSSAHSVLTDATDEPKDPSTADDIARALESVVTTLREQLVD